MHILSRYHHFQLSVQSAVMTGKCGRRVPEPATLRIRAEPDLQFARWVLGTKRSAKFSRTLCYVSWATTESWCSSQIVDRTQPSLQLASKSATTRTWLGKF